MSESIYDIRTSDKALSTLINFTGVSADIWQKYLAKAANYKYDEYLVEDVINTYGCLPDNYTMWQFLFFHITTSANNCDSYRKNGIMDLRKAYLCKDSELRIFLESKGIRIDIEKRLLKYRYSEIDISYGNMPVAFSKQYNAWEIGRKFYYDYTICVFLSVSDMSPYGGNVHCRPEILSNIDNLLGLELSQEWVQTHNAYEIVASVQGKDIVYDGNESDDEGEKAIHYMTKAFNTAFGFPSEEIVLLKNNTSIEASRIIEINSLNYWK